MKNVMMAIRSLFKKGRHNMMKIISLGVGLAVGLVLISKVYFEQSYDDFFPDGNRIYKVHSVMEQDGELKEWPGVSGAIAPGIKAELPEVEAATRITQISDSKIVMLDDQKKYNAETFLGDSCLFDVFPRPILAGDPKEVLSRPMYAMISSEIAENIGGDVIGRVFQLDSRPGLTVTIGGIFEKLPENSHLKYGVVISMSSIAKFTWDGSMNWVGNDRYAGYIKLLPGVQPESLASGIRTMQEKYQPLEEMKKAGVELGYSVKPLAELHAGSPEVKRMTMMLLLLAFALIFTAVMNYILIVISSIVNRSKEVAVHKCYGASGKNIHSMVLSETVLHMLLSLLLAVLLIFLFQGTVEELLDASLGALLVSKGSLLLLAICVVVFLVTGLVPGYLYSRIPVASAFRSFKENRRVWKLGLLFLQFIAVGFLVSLLVIIGLQYNYMVNDHPGYGYDRLAYCSLAGVDSTARQKSVEEVMRLPGVEQVTTCSTLPYIGQSGNNIFLPGDDKEYFNIADLYGAGNGYLEMMEIPVIMGRSFLEDASVSDEVMVSRSFVEKMQKMTDWSDGAVGKHVLVTEHSEEGKPFVICGVYEDFRLGTINSQDERPSVLFYTHKPSSILLIKFHDLTPDGLAHVTETLKALMPDREVNVYDYQSELTACYKDSRQFRDSVLIGGLTTLLIALIGLIGYVNDETNRRRSEIAIRKINGATVKNILSLFLKDILRMALPALVFGGGLSAYVAQQWQEQFTEKIPLSSLLFLFCGVMVLLVILTVVCINCYRTANDNPVDSLKNE